MAPHFSNVRFRYKIYETRDFYEYDQHKIIIRVIILCLHGLGNIAISISFITNADINKIHQRQEQFTEFVVKVKLNQSSNVIRSNSCNFSVYCEN